MKTISLQKQSGSSLIVVISVLATLMVIVGIAAEYTTTINGAVARSNTLENAIAVGDSCIEVLFANWRSTCRVAPTTAVKTSGLTAVPTPTPGMFTNLPSVTSPLVKRGTDFDPANDEYDANYTISNYKVVAVDPEWNALQNANKSPIPALGQVSQEINTLKTTTPVVYNYVASADVTLPAIRGNVVAKVRRVFQKQQVSPWSFAIFYVDPLEIHPGPQFTITGWVHTNSDLYTAHSSLTFADRVTYGSDWHVDFKPGDLQHPNDTPASPNYLSNLPPAQDVALQPFGLDSSQLMIPGGNTNNDDSYRELIEPPSNAADPLVNTRFWDQADVIIQISDTPSPNTVTIGTPHFNGTNYDGTITPLPNGALLNMFSSAGTITTNQPIQDNREVAQIRLTTLDISKILNNTNGLSPKFKANSAQGFSKGIIYIYDNSATSSARRGIRLVNGSKIPSSGLTIVSNNPVYIQGDFNTGRDYAGTTNPPSNSGNAVDAVNPTVSGYTRAPCSVAADAVNILSNSWNDLTAGTAPKASNTTVNTAILSGIVPTSPAGGDGAYSGGAENFPRFLETWGSDRTLTYYGSMVELYKSMQSVGEWTGNPSVYSPPVRRWYFDTAFKINPPPGTIMVYSYVKGKWSLL